MGTDTYSCFTCGHVGNCEYDNDDEEVCPNCGTHSGDGFGLSANEQRLRVDAAVDASLDLAAAETRWADFCDEEDIEDVYRDDLEW